MKCKKCGRPMIKFEEFINWKKFMDKKLYNVIQKNKETSNAS